MTEKRGGSKIWRRVRGVTWGLLTWAYAWGVLTPLAHAQPADGAPLPRWVLRLQREESLEELQKRLPRTWKILFHDRRFVWAEGASVSHLSGFERIALDEPLSEARWLIRSRVPEAPFSATTLSAELVRLGGRDSVRIREVSLEEESLETAGAWESAARRACREAHATPVLFSSTSAAPWLLLRSHWFPSRATESGKILTEELAAQGCWGAHPGDSIFPLLMRLAQAQVKTDSAPSPVSLFLDLERWEDLSLVSGERDAVRALNLAANGMRGEAGLVRPEAPECSRNVPACLALESASPEGRACREDLRLALSRCEKPEMAGVTALADEILGTDQWQEATRLLQLAESRVQGTSYASAAVPASTLARLWERYQTFWKKASDWKWKIASWLLPVYLEELSRKPKGEALAAQTLARLLEATEFRAFLADTEREPEAELQFLKSEFQRFRARWGEDALVEWLTQSFDARLDAWRQGRESGMLPLLSEIRWVEILRGMKESGPELGHWVQRAEATLLSALDTQVFVKGPVRSPATAGPSDGSEANAPNRLPAAVRNLIRSQSRSVGEPTRFLSSQEVSKTNAAVGVGALRALSEEPRAEQEDTARIRVEAALRALEGSIPQARLSLPLRLELQDAAFTVFEKHLPKLTPEGRQDLIRRLEGVLLGLDQRELKFHGMGRLARGAWNELWKDEMRERLQVVDHRQLALSLLAEVRENGSFQSQVEEDLWWNSVRQGLAQGDPPGRDIRVPRLRLDGSAEGAPHSVRLEATAAALADRALEWVLRQFQSESSPEAGERIRRLLALRGFEPAIQSRGPGAVGVLALYSVLGDPALNASPQILGELRALKQRLRND